jgi:hypothetical protein
MQFVALNVATRNPSSTTWGSVTPSNYGLTGQFDRNRRVFLNSLYKAATVLQWFLAILPITVFYRVLKCSLYGSWGPGSLFKPGPQKPRRDWNPVHCIHVFNRQMQRVDQKYLEWISMNEKILRSKLIWLKNSLGKFPFNVTMTWISICLPES